MDINTTVKLPFLLSVELTTWLIACAIDDPDSYEVVFTAATYADIDFKGTVQQMCIKSEEVYIVFKDPQTLLLFKLKFNL